MKKILLAIVFSLLPVYSAHSTGLHRCDSGDQSSWQSKQQLENKLLSEGWKVRKIKEDGGCYEVYATTPDGQRGEAYFHPQTLELEIIARRGQIIFRNSEK